MCTRVFDNRVILAPVKWHDGDVVLEIGVAAGQSNTMWHRRTGLFN
jgi:hypothetical protein